MPTGGRPSRLFTARASGVPAGALAGVLTDTGGAPPPPEGGLVVLGVERSAGQVDADNTGDAALEFGPVTGGRLWLVNRYAVSASPAAGSRCFVYVGPPNQGALADFTLAGDGDVASGDPPLYVPGGSVLRFVWDRAFQIGSSFTNPTCTALVQYTVAEVV